MDSKRKKSHNAVSNFPRHSKGEKYTLYRLVSAVGILVVIGLLFMMGIQYVQQLRVRQELANYEAKVLLQQHLQDDLQVEIERLQNPDYIEILARDRLGLVKPDEIIFQLED